MAQRTKQNSCCAAEIHASREPRGGSLPGEAWKTVDGQCFDQHEEYRLARITSAKACAMDINTVEARYGHHWWTIEELATTSEPTRPKRLALLLADAPDCLCPSRPSNLA
ncbi:MULTISPECIES: hypothetical protein [Streptomyces]|jgi:hypothetical protein|uniref:Uncharacterized protein n=1 Tax=Streptomyces spinosisporus TaxID=2927582 RepID=A0ABS9XHE2_9ACTN|nr:MULTISPECIES: hypothetical protein [Streptomyces]MCI3241502.1 hypothetical protein [Streptomyces spinosisporus]WUB33514.1 hypothetical protein OHN38_00765 [Streptomyces sp. NBC_00588]